jgi:hypothetical protein
MPKTREELMSAFNAETRRRQEAARSVNVDFQEQLFEYIHAHGGVAEAYSALAHEHITEFLICYEKHDYVTSVEVWSGVAASKDWMLINLVHTAGLGLQVVNMIQAARALSKDVVYTNDQYDHDALALLNTHLNLPRGT